MNKTAIAIAIIKFVLLLVKNILVSIAVTIGMLIGFALVGLGALKMEDMKKARRDKKTSTEKN